MKYLVSEIIKSGSKVYDIDFSEKIKISGIDLVSPAKFSGKIITDGEIFNLVGALIVTAKVPCDRCLEPFEKELIIDIDEKFSKTVAGDPEEFYLITDNEIDILDSLTKNIISQMPSKLLCSTSCPGIQYKKEENKKKSSFDILKDYKF